MCAERRIATVLPYRLVERGRAEWLRSLGCDPALLRKTAALLFVVRRVEVDHYAPAGSTRC